MSETEILQHIRTAYGAIIDAAAGRHRLRSEVMAGIIMCETLGGLSPFLDRRGPEGRGDRDREGHYHGHGLCQIDDRSFPQFCAGPDWKDAAKNIEMGARVLARKRAFLAARALGFKLTDDDLERASIAAPKTVLNGAVLNPTLSALARAFFKGEDTMINLLKRIGGALKDAVVPMFGLQAFFGPGTGETKKAAIMVFLKNAIGIRELVSGRDIVDEAEFVAGLDQAAEGVLRALKATNKWQKAFGPAPGSIAARQ
jgi:hypothetical protein